MKTLLLLLAVLYTPTSYAANESTYGLHLYFNEKEFVDVLTLHNKFAHFGEPIGGTMHVPNDFDGEIDGKIQGNEITFDLLVPKNSARPADLTFHYEGTFFDEKREQIIGYVTIPGQPGFVASFVAFLRPEGAQP